MFVPNQWELVSWAFLEIFTAISSEQSYPLVLLSIALLYQTITSCHNITENLCYSLSLKHTCTSIQSPQRRSQYGPLIWMICKHMGLQVTDKYLENITVRVINVNSITICGMYWLSQIKQY